MEKMKATFLVILALFFSSVSAAGPAAGRRIKTRGSDESDDGRFSVVGGQFANDGQYPFIVNMGGCGGSLIADKWVLTAAHCIRHLVYRNTSHKIHTHKHTDIKKVGEMRVLRRV